MDGKSINEAVRALLARRRLSMRGIAQILGVTPSSVSNQLNSDKPFGRLMAERWSELLGLNPDFLMYGEGEIELKSAEIAPEPASPALPEGSVVVPPEFVKMVSNLAEVLRLQQEQLSALTFAPKKEIESLGGYRHK